MHIPDNYLSPQTDAVMAVAMVPVWVHCIKKVRATLDREHMAFLGICAAFSFLLMMFNVPLPGGTTGHAVGGALIALLTALFDAPVALQVIIFFVVSICLLVFTRKIFVEKLKTGSEKTNVDALIGTKGIVVQPIRPFAVGQVKVNGQVWSAVGKTPETDIEQGREVKVHAIEGVKLVVPPTRQD